MNIFKYILIIFFAGIQMAGAQNKINNTGNLQLLAGANIGIFGNFTNTGTVVDAGTMVYFSGASAQDITSIVNTSFSNLTINNASGVTIAGGTVTINGSIVFVNGILHTSAVNLLIVNDNATTSGASAASYAQGPVEKIGNDIFTFPVGKSGNYQPVYISAPTQVTDAFTAEYFQTDPKIAVGAIYDAGIYNISGYEYWNLDRTVGTSNVSVTLGWNSSSGGVTDLPDFRVAAWNGASWNNLGNGGTTGTTGAGTVITAAPATVYGPYTLASNTGLNPLPVTLLFFQATLHPGQVDLNWQTASEINNDHFTLEKSSDGVDFVAFATVKGAGTSNCILKYENTDLNPFYGISYYRLKQTDYNGKYAYSNVIPVNRITGSITEMEVYPNPAMGDINVKITADAGSDILLSLKDIYGRVCYTQSYVSSRQPFGIIIPGTLQLNPGVYTLSVRLNNTELSKKIIVK